MHFADAQVSHVHHRDSRELLLAVSDCPAHTRELKPTEEWISVFFYLGTLSLLPFFVRIPWLACSSSLRFFLMGDLDDVRTDDFGETMTIPHAGLPFTGLRLLVYCTVTTSPATKPASSISYTFAVPNDTGADMVLAEMTSVVVVSSVLRVGMVRHLRSMVLNIPRFNVLG